MPQQPFIGQITVYPYSFPPFGWADCAGQLLPIRQYTALFSLLGTYYGGDGITTFGLPDLQGRVPVNQGIAPGGSTYVLGEKTGSEGVSLSAAQSGRHNHSLNATTAQGTTTAPGGNLLATALVGNPRNGDIGLIYNAAGPNATLATTSIAQAGGPQPHNNLQPFLVLRYCIALNGVFPSRP